MNYIKNLVIISFFCVLSNNVLAQNIFGEIYDENNEPLLGATAYIEGTSLGSMTNQRGFFEIIVSSEINASLIISYIGYEKIIIQKPKLGLKYKIYLKPKTEELNEVVLNESIFSRKRMMRVFKEQFLGETISGKKCIIENENEIYFYYDAKSKKLEAYSDVPLVIDNPYLGYKVYYDLSRFEVNYTEALTLDSNLIYSSVYSGDSRFVETDTTATVVKRRDRAFEGSITHFMRELKNNNFSEKGFQIFEDGYISIPEEHFTIQDTLGMTKVTMLSTPKNRTDLNFKKTLNVVYKYNEQSKITFSASTFYIDHFGLFSDYEIMLFSGVLTDKRIGDLLPSNYGIN